MLLLDENLPREISTALNTLDVSSNHVLDHLAPGATDFQVLELAQRLGAILVTSDLDFTTRKAWFLDMAARGVSVVVLRPPKGARIDQLAEMILWHHRAWPDIVAITPTVISVKVPTQRARQLALIDFERVEAASAVAQPAMKR